MAHHEEPMDVDSMESDFDNKENTYHHSNVLPSTEKGYEELDVSELNMKLRYSITPAGSPMSKSYNACIDNRNLDSDDSLNCNNENDNLTRSLNSTVTKNDSVIQSLKSLPLQALPTEHFIDSNGNPSVHRQLDATIVNNANVMVTVSETNDIDESLSLPSSSSSALHTPEATTPTKEIKNDEDSPIIRGLKSVFNMFRSSQSPIPPSEGDNAIKPEVLSPADVSLSRDTKPQAVSSTPIAAHRQHKDSNSSKRSSPLKDSIVFNEDLEKELQWKDETTILFSDEKIPVHKLFFQHKPMGSKAIETSEKDMLEAIGCKVTETSEKDTMDATAEVNLNSSMQCMDISYNDSITYHPSMKYTTMTEKQDVNKTELNTPADSDSEFVDCETTLTKNESQNVDVNKNESELSDPLCVQKLNSTLSISATEKTPLLSNEPITSEAANLSTNISVSQPDLTNKIALLDYSVETSEILSELEKIEENLSSNALQSNTINNSKENIQSEKEKNEHQAELNEQTFNVTIEGTPVENASGEIQNANITQTSENKTFVKEETFKSETVEQLAELNEQTLNATIEGTPVENASGEIQNANTTQTSENKTFVKEETFKSETVEQLAELNEHTLNATIEGTPVENASGEIQNANITQTSENKTFVKEGTFKSETVEQLAELNEQTLNATIEGTPVENASGEIQNANTTQTSENKTFVKEETFKSETVEQQAEQTQVALMNDEKNIVLQNSTIAETSENNTHICEQNENLGLEVETDGKKNTDVSTGNQIINTTKTIENKTFVEETSKDQVVEQLTTSGNSKTNITLEADIQTENIPTQLENANNTPPLIENILLDVSNAVSGAEVDKEPVLLIVQNEAPLEVDNKTIIYFNQEITSAPQVLKDVKDLDHEIKNLEWQILENINVKNSENKNQIEDKGSELLSDELVSNKTIEIVPNQLSQTTHEKPADIPLPDEDDIDTEILTDKPHVVPHKTALIVPPEFPIEVQLDITKAFEDSQNAALEDKSTKDIAQSIEAQGEVRNAIVKAEVLSPTASKDCVPTCEQITSDIPQFINDSQTVSITTGVTFTEGKSEQNQNTIQDFKYTFTEIDQSKTQEIEPMDISLVPNTIDVTFTEDKSEQNQNTIQDVKYTFTEIDPYKTQGIEPMDISLNQTHDLPDLINQTIAVTNLDLEKTIDMQDTSKQEAAVVFSCEVVETPTGTGAEPKTVLDEKIDNPVSLLNKTEELKEDTLKSVDQDKIQIRPIINQEKPDIISENILGDNVKYQPDVKVNETSNDASVEASNNKIIEVKTIEELLVSENNSPYVSLMAGIESNPELMAIEGNFEEIENPLAPKAIPSSPPIISKGYNFNFDEYDDPFATKTKIRMSPPLDFPNKPTEQDKKKQNDISNKPVTNRRRSQPPERKKPATMKKKLNTTIHTSKTYIKKLDVEDESLKDNSVIARNITDYDAPLTPSGNETTVTHVTNVLDSTLLEGHNEREVREKEEASLEDTVDKIDSSLNKSEETQIELNEENKSSNDYFTTVPNDIKTTSSSEHSTYFSAGASSSDSLQSKNVFNLPEIDDINFNPFATKSKMRQSPPPDSEMENPFATRTKIRSSSDSSIVVSPPVENKDPNSDINIQSVEKIEAELMEKENSANTSNTTTSPKTTDTGNVTTREVNTEDEDTIEGPFLEADDGIDKISDFDTENPDMMQFNDLPTQERDENAEGELFIDAEAFEFLLNQNKSNIVAESGKESLFLKFDPLFAKRISSDGVVAALSNVQRRQSTPTKAARPSLRNEASPIAGPSKLNVTFEGDANGSHESNEDLNITVSKPMMVVTPAVNPAVTPRKSITPNRSNRRSITFTSPAIAVIDRLLSMSANNSLLGQDTTMTQANREQHEADLALTQLRELLAEKEINVYNLRLESKELKDRLAAMENQVTILEADGQVRAKKIYELNEILAEKTRTNKGMAAVVEEYERTIASLIAEIEQDKKRNAEERIRLINERDEQTAHLASMEVSFSDLHSKYEKSKQIILTCKANEDTYKKSIKDFEENFNKMQTNYELLKQHATTKLNHANQELEKMNRAHEAEVLKMNAMMKRKEMHITSLEETLAQKTKANEKLTAICDELINKVG